MFNRAVWIAFALLAIIKDYGILGTIRGDFKASQAGKITIPVIDDEFTPQEGMSTDTIFSDPSKTFVEIDINQEAFKGIPIKRTDQLMTNIDLQKESAGQAGKAIRKQMQINILKAMTTASTNKLAFSELDSAASATITYELMLTLQQAFDDAEVPLEDRFLVLKPKYRKQIMQITDDGDGYLFIGADKMGYTPLIKGQIGEIMGMKVIMLPNLFKVDANDGTIADDDTVNAVDHILAYSKDSFAFAGEDEPAMMEDTNTTTRSTEIVLSLAFGRSALKPGWIFSIRECAAPEATTSATVSGDDTSASVAGSVIANFKTTTVTFEYGETTAYGSSVAAVPATATGGDATSVTGSLTGLTAETLYHFRVKAVNALGTTYGEDQSFTTAAA